ncbi:FBD-associated F-box protein [Salix suchowensis]|nr:FBD-associated F-box protein [Salix suchowensis]
MKITVLVAPCLVKLYFNFNSVHVTDMPNTLSLCATFPTLQTLILYLDPWKMTMRICFHSGKKIPQSMDSLRNLKQLQLFYITTSEEEDLLWVLTYLNACPLLEKLDLMLGGAEFLENQREIRNICGCTYSRLKKVGIDGFDGNWYEIELITHILKSAISLDQVVINPLRSFYLGGDE